MVHGELLSNWIEVGRRNEMYPAATYGISCSDATGQPDANIPPTPNLCVFAFECDEATLTLMENDSEIEIIWVETVVSDVG